MDMQTGLFVIAGFLSILAVWLILRRADKEYSAMTDEERDENRTW